MTLVRLICTSENTIFPSASFSSSPTVLHHGLSIEGSSLPPPPLFTSEGPQAATETVIAARTNVAIILLKIFIIDLLSY